MTPIGDKTIAQPAAADPRQWVLARWHELGPATVGFGLPFVLVVYLALRGGGYDPLVRGEIGIAVWWVVLLGALVGALPRARMTMAGWVGLGLLLAFGAWTALGIGWTESSERTVAEVGRVAIYLGVFALALMVQGRDGLRRMVGGVASAIAVVGLLALLSRLQPSWFPANETAEIFPGLAARLSYPLDYWNGLAAFLAMGIPLLLVVADQARLTVTRALAAAAIPVLVLAVFFTLSRGGAVEIAVALVVLLVFYPRRLALALPLLISGVGSALAVAAATQRDALEDGLTSATAGSQGDEMLLVVAVICGGVGLLHAAIALADKHEAGPRIRVSRRQTLFGAAATALVVIAAGVAAGVPGELSDSWAEFKNPELPGAESSARFESASGSGRYQFWQSALDANATDPLLGIGAGTFEFWWAREGTIPSFVRDAHSLYLETLAETGLIGLLLIGGLIVAVLGVGVSRVVRAGADSSRAYLAGALAACAVFAFAAGIEWMWELPVVPITFFLLAAAILGSAARGRPAEQPSQRSGLPPAGRIAVAVAAVVALAATAIPLTGAAEIRESQAAANQLQLDSALQSAESAADVQPYAATPSLQEALVLELEGDLDGAAAAASKATLAEPTNWRNWLTLSRIEAERGEAEASVDAYRRARELNPRSPLFQR